MDLRVNGKNKKYKAVDRTAAQDPRLSFKAKGVMYYLLCKPDGWHGQIHDLVKNSKDGRTSIISAIKELKTFGYIKTKTIFKDNKFAGRYYEINK